jgi:hypothetical protein
VLQCALDEVIALLLGEDDIACFVDLSHDVFLLQDLLASRERGSAGNACRGESARHLAVSGELR